MKFRDIPQFPRAGYEVTVAWAYLDRHAYKPDDSIPLIMEPDYQRGHVWTRAQQVAFVEYGLMGGEMGMNITTNCPGWMGDFRGPYELVDGLQRVTAVHLFINNKIKAFDHYYKDFEDRLHMSGPHFNWRVLSLPTRKEVLTLYLFLNSGGVVHSSKELSRVKALLQREV